MYLWRRSLGLGCLPRQLHWAGTTARSSSGRAHALLLSISELQADYRPGSLSPCLWHHDRHGDRDSDGPGHGDADWDHDSEPIASCALIRTICTIRAALALVLATTSSSCAATTNPF